MATIQSLATILKTKEMDAIKEGDKIFTKIASSVSWTETNKISEASDILKQLVEATKGLVIVDFLDSGNWDSIENVEIIGKDCLSLHFRDFRNIKESEMDKEMRNLAFGGASLISSLIKFKELRIVKTKRFPVFLLRGYALKDKEIKTILSNGSTTFKILDNHDNFSKLAIRKFDDNYESYSCINTPIFSMIIIPKNSNTSALTSKIALFSYNLSDALLRLKKVSDELEKEDLINEDLICEKSNSVRRILEYVLKVELCYRYRQITVKSDYSDLLLGDLMKLVRPHREDAINEFLTKITVWSNELSHESGKPITKDKALAICYMTTTYTQLLKSEMNLNPYPHFDK